MAIADGGVYFVPVQKPTSIQLLSFAGNQSSEAIELCDDKHGTALSAF
ncbi:MAG: hypothetical protein JO249_02535 [Acidobacteria bacterium]|nr:hypothetical protein [Acidobacteriota bacterium]